MYIHIYIYIYSAYAHTYSFKPFSGNLCETRKGEPWCFRSCSRSSCFARLHCLHVVGLRLRREGLGFSFFLFWCVDSGILGNLGSCGRGVSIW